MTRVTEEQEAGAAAEPQWIYGRGALAAMREASIRICVRRSNGATALVHDPASMLVIPPRCLFDGVSHPRCLCGCHDPRSTQPFGRVTRRDTADLMSLALLHKCWRDGSGDHSVYLAD